MASNYIDIRTKTTPAPGTYEIGGFIDVTAFTLGTVSFTVSYNDETGNPSTMVVPVTSLLGVVGASAGAAGNFGCLTTSIQTDGSASIVIATTVSTFTGVYNVDGFIRSVV